MKTLESIVSRGLDKLPNQFAETARVWMFGLFKVPMLFWLRPYVLELNDERCRVKIDLNRRSRNHLGSMYFGALAAGADCAGGLMAMALIQKSGKPVALSFKDFKANFLKRADGATVFICEDGPQIQELVAKTLASGERENLTVKVKAVCPEKYGDEVLVEFELTLSLKLKSKAA